MGFRDGYIWAKKASKLTQIEIQEKLEQMGCNVTIATLSRWENGRTLPTLDNFFALCKILKIDNPLEVFSDYYVAELNEDGLLKVREYREDMIATGKYAPRKRGRNRIPLYLLPASAGTGQFLDSDEFEWYETDDDIPNGADFAIRIAGDSMEPRFHDGQNVFVHKQPMIDYGEIGVFYLDGDAYIKKLCKTESGIQLVSLNAAYAPIDVGDGSEFRVFGRVL